MPFDETDDSGCPKCGHTEAEVDKISTTGGGLSKLFDIQNRGFKTVSCTSCGYTELYKSDAGSSDLLDIFLG
ncbi:zinc ribbon domain-containing protein [Halohasta litorea]|uniref:Zinc ribbon domain-containing protein n=1 Tax=Halohasta litorea TaxID=869891 RepID=A0ABD6D466_9EURY|nr:zinc ribbon domain-containing protein [Halohasta litorea]MEA1932183.1 zinc ribbon domain-containing protein [Euryarchaeota archaeon]